MMYRLIKEEDQVSLFEAEGNKGFIRNLGSDLKKIKRFINIHRIMLDSRSERFILLKEKWEKRKKDLSFELMLVN